MEKRIMNQPFDQRIQEALRSKAGEIAPSESLLERINEDIRKNEREYLTMKYSVKMKKFKPAVIVAIVFLLSAATCFAATQITSLVSTSREAFDSFPTVKQVENSVNYTPDYVEKFSNGFFFDSASVSETAAMDSENNKSGGSKGITFFYTREGAVKGQLLTLGTIPDMEGLNEAATSNTEVIAAGDTELSYSKVTMKLVSEDYVPTEEENKQMEEGTLWISSGADEVSTSELQYVKWKKDGIVYNLIDNGYGLDKDEFVQMARDVIDSSK